MIKNNIIMRCEFIELIEHLENINIDYVDINKCRFACILKEERL